MFKTAQAAMEFLMTYGWAILVVLVVIGALSYFGVLSPATLLPEKCAFPVSVSCVDHTVSGTGITLMLQNGAGRDMLIRGVGATSDALGGASGDGISDNSCNLDAASADTTFRNGARFTFVLDDDIAGDGGTNIGCNYRDTGRDKNKYNVSLYYSWLDSQTITHTIQGELLSKGP